MDKKLDAQVWRKKRRSFQDKKDIGTILSLKMFWLVACLLCCIIPPFSHSRNMRSTCCNATLISAQKLPGRVFVFLLGAAAVTPFLGNYLDHKGKGASMMIPRCIVDDHLSPHLRIHRAGNTVGRHHIHRYHHCFGYIFLTRPCSHVAISTKTDWQKLLGSAYALIFWIQNIGLYAFPMIIEAFSMLATQEWQTHWNMITPYRCASSHLLASCPDTGLLSENFG